MPKTCCCGLKSSEIIHKYALITPLLAYIFVKNIHKKRRGRCIFSSTITIIREVQVNLSTRLRC